MRLGIGDLEVCLYPGGLSFVVLVPLGLQLEKGFRGVVVDGETSIEYMLTWHDTNQLCPSASVSAKTDRNGIAVPKGERERRGQTDL